MSLESQIAELVKALQENTAALNGIKGAAKERTGSTSSSSTASDKKADDKKADDKKKKGPTLEDVTAAATEYMNTSDADERKERKGNIAKINEKFGISRLGELKPANFAEALSLLKAFSDGEDPFADEGDDEGESPI